MTIALRVAGTAATGTTSPNPSYGAGIASTDVNILWVTVRPSAGKKPSEVVITTPTGWQKIGQYVTQDVASASPPSASETTGTVIVVYARRGSFSGSLGAIAITNVGVAAAVINSYSTTNSNGWEFASTTQGIDLVPADGFSSNQSTAAVNLSVTTGDYLLAGAVVASGALTSPTITATGATLTTNVRQNTVSTVASPLATLGMVVIDSSVTAGTSSAAPVMASSSTTGGTAVFVRLRDQTFTLASAETITVTDRVTGVPALRDWQNGQTAYAADMNFQIRDPFNWHMGITKPGIKLRNTVDIPLPASTETKIVWNSADTQNGNIVWWQDQPHVMVLEPGVYDGAYTITFDGTSGINNWAFIGKLYVIRAGTVIETIINRAPDLGSAGGFEVAGFPFTVYLRAGDYVELRVSGTWTGTASSVGGLPEGAPTLAMWWDSKWEG